MVECNQLREPHRLLFENPEVRIVDLIIALLATFAGLVVLDLAAAGFGADSRDKMPDDHRR
jgi:hypothetical protein